MSKFGDLIEGEKPILLVFYEDAENEDDSMTSNFARCSCSNCR